MGRRSRPRLIAAKRKNSSAKPKKNSISQGRWSNGNRGNRSSKKPRLPSGSGHCSEFRNCSGDETERIVETFWTVGTLFISITIPDFPRRSLTFRDEDVRFDCSKIMNLFHSGICLYQNYHQNGS